MILLRLVAHAAELYPSRGIIMNSLFGKIIMAIGALAASTSFLFWQLYKGTLTLEIFSTMTTAQALGFCKLSAAIAFITCLIMFVIFLGRDRSNK